MDTLFEIRDPKTGFVHDFSVQLPGGVTGDSHPFSPILDVRMVNLWSTGKRTLKNKRVVKIQNKVKRLTTDWYV